MADLVNVDYEYEEDLIDNDYEDMLDELISAENADFYGNYDDFYNDYYGNYADMPF